MIVSSIHHSRAPTTTGAFALLLLLSWAAVAANTFAWKCHWLGGIKRRILNVDTTSMLLARVYQEILWCNKFQLLYKRLTHLNTYTVTITFHTPVVAFIVLFINRAK
jgi:hypothetical protein